MNVKIDANIKETIISAAKEELGIQKIILFGSRAKGLAKDNSDYDIYLVISNNEEKTLIKIITDFYINTGKNTCFALDVLASKENRFTERAKRNTMEKQISDDGIVLYERL